MRRTKVQSDSIRTGGGYLYKNNTNALGLDTMFQHNNTFPWTQNSHAVAAGPRYQPESVPGNGDVRKARLPPPKEDAAIPVSRAMRTSINQTFHKVAAKRERTAARAKNAPKTKKI